MPKSIWSFIQKQKHQSIKKPKQNKQKTKTKTITHLQTDLSGFVSSRGSVHLDGFTISNNHQADFV